MTASSAAGSLAAISLLVATPALATFSVPAAKDGVVFGANVRAPRAVVPLGSDVFFTDADLGICRAVPVQQPIYAPGDAVLTVDPAACVEVIVSGTMATLAASDPLTNPPTPYWLVLAPHRVPAAGVAMLSYTSRALQLLQDVDAPMDGPTRLLPSAVAYSDRDGYAYVGYSNSDRIDRFLTDATFGSPTIEPCTRTSDGTATRALAFVGTSLFVAQAGGTGDGALGVAENIAATSCPLAADPIAAASTLGHPTFAAVTGVAAGPAGDGFSYWLFVAESVGNAALVHRLKIVEGSALPDALFVPEIYSHTGRFADLQATDAYRGDVALTYARPPQLPGDAGPGVLFVSDDPDPTTPLPAGRIWSMSDMGAPIIESPASGSSVTEVSIVGAWRGDDSYASRGTVALLFDEEGYVVASGNADANAGGAFTLAYPDALVGQRRFVVRTADSVGEMTYNVSPPSQPLTLFVGESGANGDTTPPAAPMFSLPVAGSILYARTVTFSGTAEPGATLILTIDGHAAASISVGIDGVWGVASTVALGHHVASAVARDAAGNVSPAAAVSFSVEDGPGGGSSGGGSSGGSSGGGCSTGGGSAGASLLLAAAALCRRRR